MKTVFNNGMVCHVFAQQSHDHGRNANDSISFVGDTIKSYDMKIAKFITSNVVLFTNKEYSVTTSQHKYDISKALSNHLTIFNVPEIDITLKTKHEYTLRQNKLNHKINVQAYKDEIKETVLKGIRARTNKNWYACYSLKVCDELNAYNVFFKLRLKKYVLPNADQLLEQAKKAQVLKAKKAKKAKLELIKINKEKCLKWCDGENISLNFGLDTMIRINLDKDIIETSKNASFPISHGYLALQIIKKCQDTKTAFKTNGRTIKLGYFNIDSISINGDVVAGCHKVKFEQIIRIESQLNEWYLNRKNNVTEI